VHGKTSLCRTTSQKPESINTSRNLDFVSINLLFLGSLLSGLGDLAGTTLLRLGNGFDDTDGHGLTHVTNGETSKRWVVGESLNAHGLGWYHFDDGSVTGLDEFGRIFDGFSGTAIDLLQKLGELAGNVGRVAIEDWSVPSTNLTGVVENNNLSVERVGALRGIVLGVTSNVSTTNLLHRNVLDVEADVVTRQTLNKLLVVHLDGLDFSGNVGWGEGHDHTGLDYTSLDTTDRNSPDTTDLVDILERKAERLVGRTGWGFDGINGLQEGFAGGLGLSLLLPALVPGAVGGVIDHVITVESGDRNERYGLGVVSNFLDEVGGFLDDLVEPILGPFRGIHLIDGDNELLDTQGVGEKSVFAGLAILGNTSFEFTGTGSDDKDSAVSLRGTSDHVLDEITVTGSVCDEILALAGEYQKIR